jgi:NAD(P)-dependent dehydrogenase (short-subunit alcohol dehydrogenase family)
VVDVTDSEGLDKAAAEVVGEFGRVDILVVNAGITSGGTVAIANARAYERTIEVNLFGSIRTVRAFLPAVTHSKGYILQIASLAAMLPTPMMSAYGASKTGVEAFAHALRGEVRHKGVDVGVGYLTWTDTDMVRGADAIPGLAEGRASLPWPFNKTAPLGPAVQRIADGCVRRSPHVYAQAWVRLVQPFRPALFSLGRFAGKTVSSTEAALLAAGPSALGLTGAGGAADTAAQRNTSLD